ncbi:MAG TPA: hypothetical protein PLB55_07290 [Prosthecobacter sp.]|nr:hypothetical protein [Prosthecobacter sp.]
MKLIPWILIVSLMLSPLKAREFLLPEGKVEGEITAVANGVITLRMSDGKSKAVPAATLTQDDLNHAKQWWEQNRKMWFEIRATSKKVGKGESKDKGIGTESRMDRWRFTVEVRNSDKLATPEVSVDYTLHVKNPLKGGQIEPRNGQVKIPPLPPGGKHTFETSEVEVEVLKTKPGYVFIYGHDGQHKDSLDGLSMVIKAGGRTVWLHETKAGYLAGRSEMYGGGITSHVQGRPYSGPPKEAAKTP